MDLLEKIQSIINSCNTYDQVQTCISFIENNYINKDEGNQQKIIFMISDKLHQMRMADLSEHIEFLRSFNK